MTVDLDVDRDRHVLPQIGRRIGNGELHLDGRSRDVDGRIDVDETSGEALVRIGVGGRQRGLAVAKQAEVLFIDLEDQADVTGRR